MFQKMRHLIDDYDGTFERQKEDCEVRRRLAAFAANRADRERWEDFVLDYFGKREEGEAARYRER